jgi:nuclear-control-of-ATPase protein 2
MTCASFVSLTPGIMVTYAFLRWAFGVFGNRKGLQVGRRKHELRHALRYLNTTNLTICADVN